MAKEKSNTITEYVEEIGKAIAENQRQIDICVKQIEDAKADQVEASREVEKAASDCDSKAHRKAMDRLTDSKNTESFYTDRLERLKKEPVLSQEDYERIRDGLYKIESDGREADERTAVEKIREIKELADRIESRAIEVKSVLYDLQHDAMKDEGNSKKLGSLLNPFGGELTSHIKESALISLAADLTGADPRNRTTQSALYKQYTE